MFSWPLITYLGILCEIINNCKEMIYTHKGINSVKSMLSLHWIQIQAYQIQGTFGSGYQTGFLTTFRQIHGKFRVGNHSQYIRWFLKILHRSLQSKKRYVAPPPSNFRNSTMQRKWMNNEMGDNLEVTDFCFGNQLYGSTITIQTVNKYVVKSQPLISCRFWGWDTCKKVQTVNHKIRNFMGSFCKLQTVQSL